MKAWQKVPCKIWTGLKNDQGYGRIWHEGKYWLAHRLAWTQERGQIPPGMKVCHHCDVPGCYERKHLFLGTQKENVADCIKKGRRASYSGAGNGRAKLNVEQVREIRARYAAGSSTQQQLADEFGVYITLISQIVRKKVWAHV